MNEYDSPNFTEFTYEKRAEGKQMFAKILLIICYFAFVGAFFLFCYLTKILPLFAVCPVFTWMLVFFTWKYVSFDVYYTFNHGELELGRVQVKKGGSRRRAVISFAVKNAILIAPLKEATESENYKSVKRCYDFSSCSTSPNQIGAIFNDSKGKICFAIFEATPRACALIASFSPVAKNIKNMGIVN